MVEGTQIYPWEDTNFISYFWFLESRGGQKGPKSTEMKVFLWLFLIHEKSLTRKESKGKLSGKKKSPLCQRKAKVSLLPRASRTSDPALQ